MTLAHKSVVDATSGVGIADTIEGLSAIHDPGCAAALWRRNMPSGVADTLAGMDPDHLPQTRAILRPDEIHDEMEAICEEAGPAQDNTFDWLIEDVTTLVARFTYLMAAPYLRLRLEVVTTNACRKFHIDAVTARLICTYRGTGTQYGITTDGADPKRVFTVPTGAPILLRGTQWPVDPPSGLLHRSPPIVGTGETRLLLVIDPIFHPEDEI